MIWIIVAVNVVGYVQTWRTMIYAIAYEYGPPVDAGDWVGGLIFGALFSIPWPLTATIIFVHRRPALRASGVSGIARFARTPREVRLAEYRRRIEQLEREVGVR